MDNFFDNQLVNKALGLTDGQKALRPWWDIIEDVCMYALVMAGVIVFPSAAINSSPIVCTKCIDQYCPDEVVSSVNPPEIFWKYIVNYCTVHDMDRFILYFSYFLLGMGFLLIAIEKIFTSFFKADRKVNLFYKLIAKEASEPTMNSDEDLIEESRDCIEVLYSFRERDNFFKSYLYQTVLQIVVAVILFTLYCLNGIESLKKGDIMYCNVHGYYYSCTGFHTQFYCIIFGCSCVLLAGYIVCNSYNLAWLLLPYCGKMSRLMKSLRDYGSRNLQDVYFNNRDLALMLDLLAENSGVAPSLRILGLFDKDFRGTIEVCHVYVQCREGAGGDVELWVKFCEAVHAGKLIAQSKFIPSILYTVEAKPHTKSYVIETFSSSSENAISYKNTDVENTLQKGKKENFMDYTSIIRDVDSKETYTIVISTVINGKTVARVMETVEPLSCKK